MANLCIYFKQKQKLTDEVTNYEITYEVTDPALIEMMLIFTKRQTCVSTSNKSKAPQNTMTDLGVVFQIYRTNHH